MLKGYKFEILPSEEQKVLIQKTIGCNRLVYNLCLDHKIKVYEKNDKSLSKFDINNYITKLKHKSKYSFLNEVDSVSLKATSDALHQAFQRFFKGQNRYPNSVSIQSSKSFKVENKKYFLNINVDCIYGYKHKFNGYTCSLKLISSKGLSYLNLNQELSTKKIKEVEKFVSKMKIYENKLCSCLEQFFK